MRRQDGGGGWPPGEPEPEGVRAADGASLPEEWAALGAALKREAEELHRRYPAPEAAPAISAVAAAVEQRRRSRWPGVAAAALASLAVGGMWWFSAAGNRAVDGVGVAARRNVPATVASRETDSKPREGSPLPAESSWDEAWALYVSSPELEAVLDLADDEATPMRVGF